MAGFENPVFGETRELEIEVIERNNATFEISSGTVTITDAATGSAIRSEVPCTVSGHKVAYQETFSAANGYTEGGNYRAQFTVVITVSGTTWRRRLVVPFKLTEADTD